MRYEDFVLQLDASARGGFRARVVKSPFGEGGVGFALPAVAGMSPAGGAAGGAVSRDVEHAAAVPSRGELPPIAIGTEIYRSVFQGQVRTLLDKCRGHLERSPDLGLRLKIKLDPGDADTAALADLPWELLCDGETEDFFALSRQTSLVRYLDVPRSSQPIAFSPPLRILAVGASPAGLPPLDLAEEARRLETLHRSASGVEVQFIANASAGMVREALSGDDYNVLHFMGHGTFDRASGEGMLAFEGPDGRLDLVNGKAFATKLRDLRSLGVVVLNACNTARAGNQQGESPFRGVAAALVLGGLPAVVAMQRPISDRAAIGFSSALYRHLARGDSIDEALTEGRQAIHSAEPEAFEWATPVLFLRIPEGNVFVAKPEPDGQSSPTRVQPPASPPLAEVAAGAARVAGGAALDDRATRRTGSNRRTMLQIAAGAAGAGLIAGGLYFVIPKPAPSPDPPLTQPRGSGGPALTQPAVGTPVERDAPKTDVKPVVPVGPGKAAFSTTSRRSNRPDSKLPPSGLGSSAPLPNAASPPADHGQPMAPSPPEHKPDAAPPIADLSSLSAKAVSISHRDEGGVRVTVSFRNGAGLPLSVVLDAESTALTTDLGQRNSVLHSDLPVSGTNPRLDLPAGASATVHFDFPTFKAGSKQFVLAVATEDGRVIRVAGSPLTLDGPP
jgi:hypothetical protein